MRPMLAGGTPSTANRYSKMTWHDASPNARLIATVRQYMRQIL